MMLFLYAVLFGVVMRIALECGECILDVFGFFGGSFFSHLGVSSHCTKDKD